MSEGEKAAIEKRLAAATATAGRGKARATKKEALEAQVGSATDRLIEAAKKEDVAGARAALDEGGNPNRLTPVVEAGTPKASMMRRSTRR